MAWVERVSLLLAELSEKFRLVLKSRVQRFLRNLVVWILAQGVQRFADCLVEHIQATVERCAHTRIPTRLASLDALLPIVQAGLVRLKVGVRVCLIGDDATHRTF